MRYCDRCETAPASAHRKDFFFCTPCSEVIDAQTRLNEATIHLSRADDAIKGAQEHLESKP